LGFSRQFSQYAQISNFLKNFLGRSRVVPIFPCIQTDIYVEAKGQVRLREVRLGFDEAWDFHGRFRKML